MIFMPVSSEPGFVSYFVLLGHTSQNTLVSVSKPGGQRRDGMGLTKQCSWCVVDNEYISASSGSSGTDLLCGISNPLG
jgi:hypothetical protein